jgi:hypothetical protein
MWKVVKYALLVVLVGSLAIAVYSWLDTAVSLNHARQQQKTDDETRELLRKFLLVSNHGVKRREIMQVVQQNFAKGHVVKEERDRIVVDNVVFRFDDSQSLTDIRFLDTMSD